MRRTGKHEKTTDCTFFFWTSVFQWGSREKQVYKKLVTSSWLYIAVQLKKKVKMYDRVKNLKHTLAKAIYHHSMLSEVKNKTKQTSKSKISKHNRHTCVWGKGRREKKEMTLSTEPISDFCQKIGSGFCKALKLFRG